MKVKKMNLHENKWFYRITTATILIVAAIVLDYMAKPYSPVHVHVTDSYGYRVTEKVFAPVSGAKIICVPSDARYGGYTAKVTWGFIPKYYTLENIPYGITVEYEEE